MRFRSLIRPLINHDLTAKLMVAVWLSLEFHRGRRTFPCAKNSGILRVSVAVSGRST